MPKRTDIRKILVIGAGPIQIGQACEFDYSGTQALKALKQEGYETVLVNSNPATIMTDPDFADHVYIEPLTVEVLGEIIEKERPDAILPTVGGQTALNLAMELSKAGLLKKFSVELLGADVGVIEKAEDRHLFKMAMSRIGLHVPPSGLAHNLEEAWKVAKMIGFPCVIRPAFTLGGAGGNIVPREADFETYAKWGLNLSPISQILIEKSVVGWKEYELEVMRDRNDNVVIICSIENLDPMGIHTGDSITVAPQQTLTDREYQTMRDNAIRAIREIGVDTGGCNIQFAVNPKTGEQIIIEINPRVSRSSALASKATGYPIAKIAAKLAVGYTLDELPNDITKKTPASFEPSIDYVVTKIPRFSFEKFPATPDTLTIQMKSVGEVMAIGRTFKESFLKAMRSLEMDHYGFDKPLSLSNFPGKIYEELQQPRAARIWQIIEAFRHQASVEAIHNLTQIDPWFLQQIEQIVQAEKWVDGDANLKQLKQLGFSDKHIASLSGMNESEIRKFRKRLDIRPVYKMVDSCAAEFESSTTYLYSTYENEEEAPPSDASKKVIILGSGPNRIGQGIEFDYCCVHASLALKEAGFETIMVNCNPETVSTDYDVSDRLYFEPLTFEDVLHICEKEKPTGVVIQFGGQTPLKLALPLVEAGIPILGTSAECIDLAEDRKRFSQLIHSLGLKQPESGLAHTIEEAKSVVEQIGYPILVRPSYVLGGRAMVIVYQSEDLEEALTEAFRVAQGRPVLVDRYLKGAIEVDVDAVSDGETTMICGVMEHIEEAGIHSGDSSCTLPPQTLSQKVLHSIEQQTVVLAAAIKVNGLMNIQFAVQNEEIYILEVNPRASRTVPFVSKATGIPWAKIAAQVIVGEKLSRLVPKLPKQEGVAVKSPVFPFIKFPGVDTILSAEMCSIGEVMGRGFSFPEAFAKAQLAAGQKLPKVPAKIFISVYDEEKPLLEPLAYRLAALGFNLVATKGTAQFLQNRGIACSSIKKLQEGSPNIVEAIAAGEIGMVINTSINKKQIRDSYLIRRTALEKQIAHFTNIHAAKAAVQAMVYLQEGGLLTPTAL